MIAQVMATQPSVGRPVSGPAEQTPAILLIIPALNEELCIGDVVQKARAVLPNADVLVIDDGSSDNTSGVARQAGAYVVRLPINLGIGGAVQTGLKFARHQRYDYVLRIDADGQHNPAELDRLFDAVRTGRADVAVGSRFLGGKQAMTVPFVRRVGIELFAREVSLLTGRRATDVTSGMTVLNRRAVEVLARFMPQDYPEVESRIILHGAGLTTAEIPVKMSERMAGVSSINSWRSIYYAFKVSIAVLLTALKWSPRQTSREVEGGYATLGVDRSHHLQPAAVGGDRPARTPTQVA